MLDGKMVTDTKKVRQGLVRDTDGNLQLVIWLMIENDKPIRVELKRS